ncbi:sigma factor [Streptomyces sp. NPDC002867]
MSNGSDDEFHNFMTGRWPSLVRTAYLLTGSHHDAEDLAQSALARAYAKWDKGPHSSGAWRSFESGCAGLRHQLHRAGRVRLEAEA